ncbi:thioesterase II family protein [Amycolatopsis nigrescens]|uniref:thioesterase II family protein n=1 Tax=Amycolatopsis nigrescens TaxID=381445 RepID=UPI00039BD4B3|nr:alpha/beta fold hydrolase [Amycolatopsis nigrescens]
MRQGPCRRVLRRGRDFSDSRDSRDLRLICLPFAGGSTQSFQPLAQAVTADWTVLAVQPPAGRGLDLDELAACYLELLERDLVGEGIVFGHSLGAAVAHRMAEFVGTGWPEGLSLVLSAPPVPRTSLRELTSLDDQDFLAEATRRELIDPPPLPADVLHRFVLPALRQDLSVLPPQGWIPFPVPAPTEVIGGTDDRVVHPGVLRQIHREVGASSLRLVDGGHLYPVAAPARTWEALADLVNGPAEAVEIRSGS